MAAQGMSRFFLSLALLALAAACQAPSSQTALADPTPAAMLALTSSPEAAATPTQNHSPAPTGTPVTTPTLAPTSPPPALVPRFEHVIIFLFQNKEFSTVIGHPQMPVFNSYAQQYSLLEGYYAVTHPSLPNYLALISGDTFGIRTDYPQKIIDAPILPDQIEASGRTWKAYMESMPEACALQDTLRYVQKHNPFMFFTSIRDDSARCKRHVVPLEELEQDIQNDTLPNYVFISPNLCNSGHETYARPEDCGYRVVDHWMAGWLDKFVYSPGLMENSLIVLTWDEGQGDHSCCGFETGGGRVATVLISDVARKGFTDPTPYTHYSLVRTIAEAWGLQGVGFSTDDEKAPLIAAPWETSGGL